MTMTMTMTTITTMNITTRTTTATEDMDGTGLYRLMAWLSPGFPVGAYAYSHGLEYAIEESLVRNADQLTAWVAGVLRFGAGRADADLFRAAWQAVDDGDLERLAWAAEMAAALRGTAEMALESRAQGRAFLDTVKAAWPNPGLDAIAEVLNECPASYAVAVGAVSALSAVPLRSSLIAFLHGTAANLVSAGVRLVPLGQTHGQQTIAALEAVVVQCADDSLARPLSDLGGDLGAAAPMVDWASMQHETQYTRLFRS
jgi:urease accessory protein